uniref:Uncharacterized protein n=1 Tax=Caenorhabditis japonica TaxID=281687 RepID=A0A8R1DH89_CAEJA
MVITSKTSMLTKEIILEVEINRAAGPNITTIVNSAVLTAESPPALLVSNSDATATTESENLHVATPLTTFPIENRILSVVNMVWSLPTKGSLVKHRLCVVYTVKDESPSHEYTFDDYLELTVPHVQFEFCTQVLSQQPGAQLCRATSPCHFVISLRCLRPVSSTLLVVIDSDERIWTLVERTKMVTVKDSGLGQLALTIIPVVAGFLPFPEVAIYECQLVSV